MQCTNTATYNLAIPIDTHFGTGILLHFILAYFRILYQPACGWSHVHVDSGPVRACGPVPFAVTVCNSVPETTRIPPNPNPN